MKPPAILAGKRKKENSLPTWVNIYHYNPERQYSNLPRPTSQSQPQGQPPSPWHRIQPCRNPTRNSNPLQNYDYQTQLTATSTPVPLTFRKGELRAASVQTSTCTTTSALVYNAGNARRLTRNSPHCSGIHINPRGPFPRTWQQGFLTSSLPFNLMNRVRDSGFPWRNAEPMRGDRVDRRRFAIVADLSCFPSTTFAPLDEPTCGGANYMASQILYLPTPSGPARIVPKSGPMGFGASLCIHWPLRQMAPQLLSGRLEELDSKSKGAYGLSSTVWPISASRSKSSKSF